MSKLKPRIILASTSPRRIELLKQAGIIAESKAPVTDEEPHPGELPTHLVRRLAFEKAKSVAASITGIAAVVIAADTIVVAPDRKSILNKPRDKKEAFRMLKKLVGKTHLVLTGYCIFPVHKSGHRSRPFIRVVRSNVMIKKLSDTKIKNYIATGEPMDKAGAYGAQGLGMTFIERINGSYTNVVGLPMSQLLTDLEERFGVISSIL